MPTPLENETEAEFVERCIPIVIEDGTAEDAEQAAAVCHTMFQQANGASLASRKPDVERRVLFAPSRFLP